MLSLPPVSVRLMLREEAPSAPPKNIVASGRTNQSIMVQWQPPPEPQLNGVLRGYLLRYVALGTRFSRVRILLQFHAIEMYLNLGCLDKTSNFTTSPRDPHQALCVCLCARVCVRARDRALTRLVTHNRLRI